MRKFLVFFIILYSGSVLWSQNLPEIQKKMYKAPDGKLYINKALPVYLFIGVHPDDKTSTLLLESEATKAYTNPMYFDTEGINTIQSPYCVDTVTKKAVQPLRNIIFEVYADSRPPITKIQFDHTKIFQRKGKIYVSGQVQIIFTAKDELSGVDHIMYSINGDDYKKYDQPILLNQEKEYVVKYFAYDKVGNIESINTVILVLDKSAPRVTLDFKGDVFENIIAENGVLLLNVEDTISGVAQIWYRINEGNKMLYSKPIQAKNLDQGEYVIEYWAVDEVNNESQKEKYTFYVDKTPPTIIPEIVGKTYIINGKEFSSGRALLKLTTLDNKAGVKEIFYSINQGELKKYEKPVMLNNTGGKLIVNIIALDNVNNKNQVIEGTQYGSLPYVDLTGPSVSYKIEGVSLNIGDTIFVSDKSKIRINATDDEAGLQEVLYSINKAEYYKYDNFITINKKGLHILDISAIDGVDNITQESYYVFVDTQGPLVGYQFSSPSYDKMIINEKLIPILPPYTSLFLSAHDEQTNATKIFYSLNNLPEKLYSGSITNFPNGYNVIRIRAQDVLFNETIVVIEFFIKNISKK